MRFLRINAWWSWLAVATLGLAVAAITAIFSVLYSVLLAPLPYRDAGRIVQLNSAREGKSGVASDFSLAEFDDWRASTRTLDELAAYGLNEFSVRRAGESAEAVSGAIVSDQFFSLLGTTPVHGRLLGADTSSTPLAVISEKFWRSRFGADPGIVGRTINVSGRPYSIVGVAPENFRIPNDAVALWIPLAAAKETAPSQWNMRGFRSFAVLARLKPGLPIDAAREDATAIARNWRTEYPRFSDGLLATVNPLERRLVGDVAPMLWLLAGAGAFVLAIACANLVSLLLARNVSRAREYAVRVALGASMSHVLRLAWAEAFGIAAAAGSLGLVAAWLTLRASRAFAWTSLPRAGDIGVSPVVVLFTTGVVIAVAFGVGSLVGSRAWRAATTAALGDARSRTDSRSTRLHSALVVLQVALSLALVVNASLLVRSLTALVNTDSGVANRGAITMKLSAVGRGFLDRALPQIAAVPGVRAAGVISSLPPNVSQMHTTVSVVSPATGRRVDASVDIASVSPGALEALGVRLLAGRLFTDADLSTSRRSIVIAENTAERLFPGVDPVGRALPFGPQDPSRPAQKVIGVVTPVRYGGLDVPADGAIYLPYTARPFSVTYLVVLADGTLDRVAAGVRGVIRDVDSSQAVSDVRPLSDVIRASTAAPRFRTWLVSALSIVALAIAAMGLYAVMSHGVGSRSVELGVRMALGATGAMVRRQVLYDGARLAGLGVLAGLPLAWAGTRVVARYLYATSTADPVSVTVALVILMSAAMTAAWVPAMRASRISPMEVMRR
jgi:predicted permease